ncbi:MAG TPA: hypothetical protein ENG00_01025 [Candidatus Aenigmarchaeota archaeon]|nr:hypothetical protein [Candidatus Aenigmarchaeota archaeon]
MWLRKAHIELASRGYKVAGVDINPFLLEVAEYRAKNRLNVYEAKTYYFHRKVEPVFIEADMRDLLSADFDDCLGGAVLTR